MNSYTLMQHISRPSGIKFLFISPSFFPSAQKNVSPLSTPLPYYPEGLTTPWIQKNSLILLRYLHYTSFQPPPFPRSSLQLSHLFQLPATVRSWKYFVPCMLGPTFIICLHLFFLSIFHPHFVSFLFPSGCSFLYPIFWFLQLVYLIILKRMALSRIVPENYLWSHCCHCYQPFHLLFPCMSWTWREGIQRVQPSTFPSCIYLPNLRNMFPFLFTLIFYLVIYFYCIIIYFLSPPFSLVLPRPSFCFWINHLISSMPQTPGSDPILVRIAEA